MPRPSDISNMLGSLDADALNDMDDATREVVRAVERTGQNGQITLKIDIKKNGKNSVQYTVTPTYKAPRQKPTAQIAFFGFDDATLQATGQLQDTPHRQEKLFDGGNVSPISKAKH
jgi:hypothetical protein